MYKRKIELYMSGTLLSINWPILSVLSVLPWELFAFRTSAIDVKYVFNLLAIAFASFMPSLLKTMLFG